MTPGTARVLRIICYALFAYSTLIVVVTITDARSHSPEDRSNVAGDIRNLVILAVLTLACGFAAAAADARGPSRIERDEPGIEASKPQAASGAASADASQDRPSQDAAAIPDDDSYAP